MCSLCYCLIILVLKHKHSQELCDIKDTSDVCDESNQSDSEIVLSAVQRNFSRRSKRLSNNKQKNIQSSQNSSMYTKSSNSRTSPIKPQITPRTITKPVVPARKLIHTNSESGKEISPHETSTPTCANNFW